VSAKSWNFNVFWMSFRVTYNDFIGTTNNAPLEFKVNNIFAGGIYPKGGNTILGPNSMIYGSNNVHGVVAIGSGALRNNSQSNLVAVGNSAMFNVGTGFLVGYLPEENVAIGSRAMFSNLLGKGGTAVGFKSLYSNIGGDNNTAIGDWSMYSNHGDNNTALGYSTMKSNYSGE